MRYGPEHKDQTRSALLKAAAEQMRAHGPDGVSVAAVMKRVGLTHGGFYAHFESKDDLIAEAVSAMFVHAARRREKHAPFESLDQFIDAYLSPAHRDNAARGCPIPALMSEAGRWPASARKSFDDRVARLAAKLAALMPPHVESPEAAAMSLIAEMAGAVALSRSISDIALSDALLDASRAALKQRFSFSPGPTSP